MITGVGVLPWAWHHNMRYTRRGLGARPRWQMTAREIMRSRGFSGPAAGYATFEDYSAAVCGQYSAAAKCPPPFDPSCVGPLNAQMSACNNAWVTDPQSCHNVVCDSSGQPAVSYQEYTTPTGQAAAGVGYNTTSGFVPVSSPAPVPAPTPPPMQIPTYPQPPSASVPVQVAQTPPAPAPVSTSLPPGPPVVNPGAPFFPSGFSLSSVPSWAWIAGAAVLAFMALGGGGRR